MHLIEFVEFYFSQVLKANRSKHNKFIIDQINEIASSTTAIDGGTLHLSAAVK